MNLAPHIRSQDKLGEFTGILEEMQIRNIAMDSHRRPDKSAQPFHVPLAQALEQEFIQKIENTTTSVRANPNRLLLSEYRPLPHANAKPSKPNFNPKVDIRLLDIFPGAPNAEIRCAIRAVALDSGETYDALSYVWGDPTAPRKSITIDENEVQVSQNLWLGLRRIRSQFEIRTFWVDQLCINQNDDEEKAHQVGLMGEIYKRCFRCVCWFGESELDGEFELEDINSALNFILTLSFGAQSRSPMRDMPVLFYDNEEGERVRRAFNSFASHGNPWWSRIWTVQEAVLPPRATIVWGTAIIDREWLYDASDCFHHGLGEFMWTSKMHVAKRKHRELLERLFNPVLGMQVVIRGQECPSHAFRQWRHRNSSNPLDKVYALMSLVPDASFSRMGPIDYNVNPAQLFTRVTIDLLSLSGSFEPIIGFRGEPRVTRGLPSWAIDFVPHKWSSRKPWLDFFNIPRYRQCSAGISESKGESPAKIQTELPWRTLDNNMIMIVKGIRVGRIVQLGDVLGEDTWATLSPKKIYQHILTWKKLWDKHEQTVKARSREAQEHAFWRTVLLDALDSLPRRGPSVTEMTRFKEMVEEGVNVSTGLDEVLYASAFGAAVNQSFFITDDGRPGIGPPNTKIGHELWIVVGSNVPFVLRAEGQGTLTENIEGMNSKPHERYSFISDAYVDGVMYGELAQLRNGTETELFLY